MPKDTWFLPLNKGYWPGIIFLMETYFHLPTKYEMPPLRDFIIISPHIKISPDYVQALTTCEILSIYLYCCVWKTFFTYIHLPLMAVIIFWSLIIRGRSGLWMSHLWLRIPCVFVLGTLPRRFCVTHNKKLL